MKIYKLEFKRDNPVIAKPAYVPTKTVPVAQPKDYSHLSGQWCSKEYPETCFEMLANGVSFTLKRTQAVGGYGLVLYRKFKGTITEKGLIDGKYHYAQSFPGKCNNQAVWYRSPNNLMSGSRLYPGEEEMILRYNETCYQMDESTCEGIYNSSCVPWEIKMHFIRS